MGSILREASRKGVPVAHQKDRSSDDLLSFKTSSEERLGGMLDRREEEAVEALPVETD